MSFSFEAGVLLTPKNIVFLGTLMAVGRLGSRDDEIEDEVGVGAGDLVPLDPTLLEAPRRD